MKILVTFAAMLVLAGCMTREERAAKFAVADDTQCRSMGAQPGTEIYVTCRMFQQKRRDDQDAADNEFDAAMAARGDARRPINCTSSRMGSMVSTNCY